MSSFCALFPSINSSNEVYLDTAATSQRLGASVAAMNEYYQTFNANVHRGTYSSAVRASNEYETARQTLASFLGARESAEIIFTSGATDSLNLVANGLDPLLLRGKVILICESEHHANLLPWQMFAKLNGFTLKKISLGKKGEFTEKELNYALASIDEDVAIVAMAHVSNALGNIYPVQSLCEKASKMNALTVIDGTQAAAHININVSLLGCDFYCISGHKMYAGTGIGVLYGKMQCLQRLRPSKLGGEMITSVTWDSYELQEPPGKFEAGTPNIAGAIGMAAAATFIKQNLNDIQNNEKQLSEYLLTQISPLILENKIIVLGNICHHRAESIALLSFYSSDIHANDIASFLSAQNIAVRAGHHCAMPLMQSLYITGCVRLSMGCYTTKRDIDIFVSALFSLFEMEARATDNKLLTASAEIDTQVSNIERAICEAKDWNSKHRTLLLYSKTLDLLPENMRLPENEVHGCEAQVWLALDERRRLKAYSNSKIIRGILALIITKLNTINFYELENFDIAAFLTSIGLSHYFSQGRRDGIHQVILRIETLYS